MTHRVVLLSNHNNWLLFTDGYVITVPAAMAVLKANMPMRCPCDCWWRWERRGLVDVWHSEPAVVDQDLRDSIIGRTPSLSQMNLAQKVFWKIKRAIGVAILLVWERKRGAWY